MQPARFHIHVLMAGCLLALPAQAASINGAVQSPSGAPFRGAFVQAENLDSKIRVSVLTDSAGRYDIPNLSRGRYRLSILARGYRAAPVEGLALTEEQTSTRSFRLQNDTVRWNEISAYEAARLWPDRHNGAALPGKAHLTGMCFSCHQFQTRMAPFQREREAWHASVEYMQASMGFFMGTRGFGDKEAQAVTDYLTLLFGKNSILPASPADLPAYRTLARAFDDEAMKIVYVEYRASPENLMPWSAAPAADGTFWIPFFGTGNRIARLDPNTGKTVEYRTPHKGTAAIHSAVPAPDGTVWLAQQGSNKLGKWDPKTKTITEYQDNWPRPSAPIYGDKHTSRVDAQGRVWSTGKPLTVFDPKTEKFTHIEAVPRVYGIVLDKDGNGWFAEFTADGKIGKVDAKTLKVTKWIPPSKGGGPRRIQIDHKGMIWFAEYLAGNLVRFDPETQAFKVFPLPGPEATPYALGVAADGTLWYSSENMDVLGQLDPETGKVREYPYPGSENTMREFFTDAKGRMWFGSPANNTVGYFYIDERKKPLKAVRAP